MPPNKRLQLTAAVGAYWAVSRRAAGSGPPRVRPPVVATVGHARLQLSRDPLGGARKMSATVRILLVAVLLSACASVFEAEPKWRHPVALRPSNIGPALVLRLSKATIRCPLHDLVQFSQSPGPLRPDRQRSMNALQEQWRAESERLEPLFIGGQDYAVSRRDFANKLVVGDLLHAGRCSVLDHKREAFAQEIVVIPYDDRISFGRIFEFSDGRPFFERPDGIR